MYGGGWPNRSLKGQNWTGRMRGANRVLSRYTLEGCRKKGIKGMVEVVKRAEILANFTWIINVKLRDAQNLLQLLCPAEMFVSKWALVSACSVTLNNSLTGWSLNASAATATAIAQPRETELKHPRQRGLDFLKLYKPTPPVDEKANCRHSESLLEPSIFSPATNWVARMFSANVPFDSVMPPTCDLCSSM